MLPIGTLGTNFSEILIKIQNFSFTEMHLKISSAKWRPFCPGGDELTQYCIQHYNNWIGQLPLNSPDTPKLTLPIGGILGEIWSCYKGWSFTIAYIILLAYCLGCLWTSAGAICPVGSPSVVIAVTMPGLPWFGQLPGHWAMSLGVHLGRIDGLETVACCFNEWLIEVKIGHDITIWICHNLSQLRINWADGLVWFWLISGLF